MSEEEKKTYFEIYTAFWRLFSKYSTLDGTDSFWSNLIRDANDTYEAYKDVDKELSKTLAVSTANAIQRIYKRKVSEIENEPRQMTLREVV